MEALAAKPTITAAEFARNTGLSRSYAASLLRRARTQMTDQTRTDASVPAAESIRQRAGDLYRRGNSPDAIAAELGIARAEVDFVIRLEELLQAA
jgi:DNA-binding CsgD family transcriptional regulator